jgi:quercetin dioxygenase-like cupin family protein
MSVHITRSDRKPFKSGDAFTASAEELKDAFDGYFGYFGTYTIDEKAETVTHHIESASYPNYAGTDQRRFFTWQGDRLVLSTRSESGDGADVTYAATWERQPRGHKEMTMSMGDSATAQESIQVGLMSIRYLIDGTATGGMGVFELSVPPKANVPPPHSHTGSEECVYVLEGVLRYAVNDVARELRRGEWMFTPRGSVHQFSNPYDELARALIILTPDIGAQYFRDVAAVVNAGGPPDRSRLLQVMTRYGLVPAPQK